MNFGDYMRMVRSVPEVVVCLRDGARMLHMQDVAALECPTCKARVTYLNIEMSAEVAGMTSAEWAGIRGAS